jgi:hypothetical protein
MRTLGLHLRLLVLVVLLMVGREGWRGFILDSSHAIPFSHNTPAMSSRVKTAASNAGEDENAKHDGKGYDESEICGF